MTPITDTLQQTAWDIGFRMLVSGILALIVGFVGYTFWSLKRASNRNDERHKAAQEQIEKIWDHTPAITTCNERHKNIGHAVGRLEQAVDEHAKAIKENTAQLAALHRQINGKEQRS